MEKCSLVYKKAWERTYFLITAKGYTPRYAVKETAEKFPLTDFEYFLLHRDFLSHPTQAIESFKMSE